MYSHDKIKQEIDFLIMSLSIFEFIGLFFVVIFVAVAIFLVLIILYGYKALIQGRPSGFIFSWLLVVGGVFAFLIHGYFLLQGSEAFRLPVSLALIILVLIVSLAQAVALLKVRK